MHQPDCCFNCIVCKQDINNYVMVSVWSKRVPLRVVPCAGVCVTVCCLLCVLCTHICLHVCGRSEEWWGGEAGYPFSVLRASFASLAHIVRSFLTRSLPYLTFSHCFVSEVYTTGEHLKIGGKSYKISISHCLIRSWIEHLLQEETTGAREKKSRWNLGRSLVDQKFKIIDKYSPKQK